MTITVRIATTAVAVLMTGAMAACSSDKPAVCDDVDTLQSSIDNLQDVQVSENGLNAMSSTLTQIKQDLQQLGADTKAEFGDEADAVRASVTALEESVDGAKADPSSTTLSAVGTAVTGVEGSLTALIEAVSGTC